MSFLRLSRLIIVALLLSTVLGCGSGNNAADHGAAAAPKFSKEIGLKCLSTGDLGCAQDNFCALGSDPGAGLRCCVSGFLNNYFSENTRQLGQMLGYAPLSFSEVRQLSHEDIVKKKALPFAEIFLLSQDESPKIQDLLEQWGLALVAEHASTEELNQRFAKFGAGLEASSACLERIIPNFQADALEKEVFASDNGVDIGARDLNFLEFLAGTLAYLIEGASSYQAGFANFPSLPFSETFLSDLNGHAGVGDTRLGDLDEGAADALAGKLGLLQGAFASLKTFSELKDHPTRIDAYLNWRFSDDTQQKLAGILKAAYLSLIQSTWVALPDSDWALNLSNLGNPTLVPNGRHVDSEADLLSRDNSGKIQINHSLLKAWAQPVLRETTE